MPLADGGTGNFYPSLTSPSTSSSSKEGTLDLAGEGEEGRFLRGNFYPSAEMGDLVAAFREAGIGKNMWAELAGYEWVTVAYVQAHTWLAKKNGDPPSYQIQRMRCGDAAPVVRLEECPECGSKHFWDKQLQSCYKCSGLVHS
jgi:hypothetical protein